VYTEMNIRGYIKGGELSEKLSDSKILKILSYMGLVKYLPIFITVTKIVCSY
jgi:hypothetical protein